MRRGKVKGIIATLPERGIKVTLTDAICLALGAEGEKRDLDVRGNTSSDAEPNKLEGDGSEVGGHFVKDELRNCGGRSETWRHLREGRHFEGVNHVPDEEVEDRQD